MVFSDDFLHFLKIKIFFPRIYQNYLVALRSAHSALQYNVIIICSKCASRNNQCSMYLSDNPLQIAYLQIKYTILLFYVPCSINTYEKYAS